MPHKQQKSITSFFGAGGKKTAAANVSPVPPPLSSSQIAKPALQPLVPLNKPSIFDSNNSSNRMTNSAPGSKRKAGSGAQSANKTQKLPGKKGRGKQKVQKKDSGQNSLKHMWGPG
jgi:hypothetical protein